MGPEAAGLSSEPLSGSFSIYCDNLDGNSYYTEDISYNAKTSTIRDAITTGCPALRDRFRVWDGETYEYEVDGRDIFIEFDGINQDVGEFAIVTGFVTPLVGNLIAVDAITFSDFSTNLFYAPIPFEFLYSYHTYPEL
mmetsp:Transcript_29263/g.28389  ORF Transcript_29263/g.28389 Transcript_29263/m.28389 type:complete len:138 (-) Transcript_29263:1665-2078(-)